MNVIRFEHHRAEAISGVARMDDRTGHLAALLRCVTDTAVITVDRDGAISNWSEGARSLLGWTEAEVIGKPARQLLCAGKEPGDACADLEATPDDAPLVTHGWCLRKDGPPVWILSAITRVNDQRPSRGGWMMILREEANDPDARFLDGAEPTLLRAIVAASRDCIDILGLDGLLAKASDGDSVPPDCAVFATTAGAGPDAEAAFAVARGGGVGRFSATSGLNGTMVNWEVQVTPILGDDGRPCGLLALSRDVTETQRSVEHNRLLMLEMSHRLKNALTVVHAIASQTLRGPTMPETLRAAFTDRLATLAHAHEVLNQTGWETIDLHRLVQGVAALHGTSSSQRVRLTGPPVTLGPRLGLSLAMVLHELGTNALKYGALSAQEGAVDLLWDVGPTEEGSLFRLTWAETGGPRVTPPRSKGFGTKLIALSFPPDLGYIARLSFPPGGVVFTLQCPMSAILQP